MSQPECVLGTGVDLVENDRVQQVIGRWGAKFKDRVFLAAEQAYCEAKASPWMYYAGRLAVKEALSKAFGTGISEDLSWLDMEVVKDPSSGAPSIRLSPRGAVFARSRGVQRILVSLSHTGNFAIAQALLIGSAPVKSDVGG